MLNKGVSGLISACRSSYKDMGALIIHLCNANISGDMFSKYGFSKVGMVVVETGFMPLIKLKLLD